MPTKSGKVKKQYKRYYKKTWASSRRVKGWAPARQSKYFSTTLMGLGPIIIQLGSQGDIAAGNLTNQRASYQFQLSNLANPEVTHYAAVFDEYRIDKIEVHHIPRATQTAIINSTEPVAGTNPIYYNSVTHFSTEIDPNVPVPSTSASVMQQDSYFNIEQTRASRFTFKPRAVQVIQSSGVQAQSSMPAGAWISCDDLNALYTGLQWYADPCTTIDLTPGGIPGAVYLWVRVFVSFRNI